MTRRITEPGIYTIPAADYHADPVPGGSLSRTGAAKLLDCPAKFRYWADHEEESNLDFDIGKAAHDLALRGEDTVSIVHCKSWQSNAAKTQKIEAYAAGKIPLLVSQWQRVQDMVGELFTHPIASALLRGGKPEQTIIWHDVIWRRARLDFLQDRPLPAMSGVDYKTCKSAHPDAIERALWENSGVQQAAWYLDGLEAMGLAARDRTKFLFICQEKTPPYIVTIGDMELDAIRWGRRLNARAVGIYQRCVATQRWPGYEDEPVAVGLPSYAEYKLDAAMERGDFEPVSA